MRAAVIAAVMLALASQAAYRPDAWKDAPLGIGVTRCDCSTRGVFVEFETDLEPPFLVGVYRMVEIGMGRKFPIREVEIESKSAYIPMELATIPSVFVQVMTTGAVSRCSTNELARRELTPSEFRSWKAAIEHAVPWTHDDPVRTFELYRGNSMEIVDDYLWAGFVKTSETNLCFTLAGRKYEPNVESVDTNMVQDVVYTNVQTVLDEDLAVMSSRTNAGMYSTPHLDMEYRHDVRTNSYAHGGYNVQEIDHHPLHNDHIEYVTNYSRQAKHAVPLEYSFRLGGDSAGVGSGYRILMFEDIGICQAQRAYSARTNMSDTIVVPRGFRALSSHNGYVYTSDWEGKRYFQRVTNRVDHAFGY